jgi:hypothetical protein
MPSDLHPIESRPLEQLIHRPVHATKQKYKDAPLLLPSSVLIADSGAPLYFSGLRTMHKINITLSATEKTLLNKLRLKLAKVSRTPKARKSAKKLDRTQQIQRTADRAEKATQLFLGSIFIWMILEPMVHALFH